MLNALKLLLLGPLARAAEIVADDEAMLVRTGRGLARLEVLALARLGAREAWLTGHTPATASPAGAR